MATYRAQLLFNEATALNAADVMVVSPHFDVPEAPASESDASAIANAINLWAQGGQVADSRNLWGTGIRYVGVKVYHRGTAGPPFAELFSEEPVLGSNNPAAPREVAGVASLITSDPRVRGRIYWPLAGLSFGGRTISQNGREAICRATVNLDGAVRAAPIAEAARLCVFSPRLGTALDVIEVRADDRYDTQRRRDYDGAGATSTRVVPGDGL